VISYNRSDKHDLLIAQWWGALRQVGEFDGVFSEDVQSLGAFMEFWRGSCVLVFDTDEQGMTVAMWFQPAMSGAFSGLWVRPDKRRSPSVFRQIELGYSSALCHWPVLIGVTKQEQLLKAHRKLGYDVLGRVPHLWNGDPAWIVILTREGFDAARSGRRAVDSRKDSLGKPGGLRAGELPKVARS
jgi:hypothetical protein